MHSRPLWRISVATAPEAEEAVTEMLENAFGLPAASFTDCDARRTMVTVFQPKKPNRPRATRAELMAAMERIKALGLRVGPSKISVAKVRPQDWAESWKRHFRPIDVGATLLVKPSWSKRCPRPGQAVVVLDPGLSFGTGQHPTTAFCLRQLAARRKSGQPQSFLDLGTGSGILALAAAKLGYTPVDALDCDPEAIRIARANASKNRLSGRIHFILQDLTKLPRRWAGKYALVCANLVSTLLLNEREVILARLHSAGLLVVGGILKTEFPLVQKSYEAAGLRLVASRTEKEWKSGTFARCWGHSHWPAKFTPRDRRHSSVSADSSQTADGGSAPGSQSEQFLSGAAKIGRGDEHVLA